MSGVITTRRARLSRTPLVLATGLSTALVLAGCSSTEEGTASPAPTSSSAASSSSSSEESDAPQDLAAGLLPADAFGDGVTILPLTEEDLAGAAALAGAAGDVVVTPESCSTAVTETTLDVADLEDFAAQGAQNSAGVVVELISIGGTSEDPVGDLTAAVETCPEAAISSAVLGEGTITFARVDVPDLGDGAAAALYTTSLTGPDGSAVSVPAFVGLVVDGDRLVTLTSSPSDGTVDEAAFTELLQQAYEHQADALG